MPKPILNLDQVQLETQQQGELFEAKLGAIGSRLGAQKLGYRLTVLPPGKKAFPFHNHHVNEEMFFILSGTGVLRWGEQEFPLRQHDVICCPPGGSESAHQIINTSQDELRYLSVSTMQEPDVMEYPDSGKFGVYVGTAPGGAKARRTFSIFCPQSSGVDYWQGEDQ